MKQSRLINVLFVAPCVVCLHHDHHHPILLRSLLFHDRLERCEQYRQFHRFKNFKTLLSSPNSSIPF